MLNLKNTIAQTEDLKNKVKQVKDRINATVVRGGGTTSKSLEEIPNNIKSMISNNYKKIAIINPNQSLTIKPDVWSTRQVSISLNFKPSVLFIRCELKNIVGDSGKYITIDSRVQNTEGCSAKGQNLSCYVKNITQNGFVLGGWWNNRNTTNVITVTQVIAIE